jgi:STE24 endopeptidase
MSTFTVIFLLAVVAQLALRLWLSRRQLRHVVEHRAAVPASFEGAVTPGEHARAADYEAAGQRFDRVEAIYDSAVLLLLTLGGGIAVAGEWAAAAPGSGVAAGTAHVLLVFAGLALLSLPFAAYRTFVLEARFGFNRTSPAVFVTDRLKSWLLGLILGGAMTAAVLWIMQRSGQYWWVLAWAAWFGFSLLATWAWPRFIAPLFNRFTPLADAPLRQRIDALLARCDFQARELYVMDGSRRSSHGNAYFTGLGRAKRIVFFDTLLASLTPAQVESVLAHELAHFKLRHVPQRLVLGAAMGLAGFALLGWLARQDWFYQGLGVTLPGDSSALLLFVFVVPAFTWLLEPLLAAWSRRHEYEADAFAARHSDGRALAEALVTLYKDNATTLTPDPLYSAFHDSHPPPTERIGRLLAAVSAPR